MCVLRVEGWGTHRALHKETEQSRAEQGRKMTESKGAHPLLSK